MTSAMNATASASRPPSPPSPASLHQQARQGTAAAHAALEQTPLMRVMAAGAPSLADYRRYLAWQLRLQGPLELALAPWVPQAWREGRLVKAQWLRSDLSDLSDLSGLGQPAAPARPSSLDELPLTPPPITSEAQALGTLYVLEGATLGLQVVHKRLQLDHPGRTAVRFMTGYGSDTGASWRRFIERLDRVPEAEWPRAIEAAGATFAAFLHEFSGTTS
jgi:heme oxygenase